MFIKVERVSRNDPAPSFPDGVQIPVENCVVDLAALERAINPDTPWWRRKWWGEE